jgi:ribosomal protein S18 acetylase RimI-like enzyme
MIHLRPMQISEFPDFSAYFVADYAEEISANYDQDIAAARTQAQQDISRDLPQGVDTPGQHLLCIVREDDENNTPIGYLWCKPETAGQSVFISDFYMFPDHRGKGYGKSALLALEAMFTKTGHTEVRLRVAADNAKAQRLYTAMGYTITGINMRKAFSH